VNIKDILNNPRNYIPSFVKPNNLEENAVASLFQNALQKEQTKTEQTKQTPTKTEQTKQTPTTNKKRVLYGNDAINAVEKLEGRKLSPIEKRVVVLEGFVPETYLDTKGIPTFGVGQTGEWANKSFGESFKHHEDLTRKLIKDYDKLPEELKAELVQSAYRGDLGGSPKTRLLFNEGKYEEAAKEFLNNKEYKAKDTPQSIKDRMFAVAQAMKSYGSENNDTDMPSMDQYVVQEGDTLYSISKKLGKTVAEIVDTNEITNPDQIKPGESLLI